MAIRFGSALGAELAAAERREWLVTNGLGSYASGTVAGSRSRSYHGLLVAALAAPVDPGSRTLRVAGLEERAHPAGEPAAATPLWSQRWSDGRQEPAGHRAIVAFALEGSVPCWRYAIGDALLEKRLWMQPGAHTTWVHYRLLQASRPLRLELTVLVNARCHPGGAAHPPIAVRPIPHGVLVEPAVAGVPPRCAGSPRATRKASAARTMPQHQSWGAAGAQSPRRQRSDDDYLTPGATASEGNTPLVEGEMGLPIKGIEFV
ncbi:MAG: glycogen debranching enzyme N-terminal domain-containing protein [Cyanobium sp.]